MKIYVSIFRDDNATDSRIFDKRRFDVESESLIETVGDDIKQYLAEQYFEIEEESIL